MDYDNDALDTTDSYDTEPELTAEELDDLWDDETWDDDPGFEADPPAEADPQQPAQPEAQQTEQHPTPAQQEQQEDGKPADPQAEPKPPELYTLKNRDETRQVTLEQMQAMAQKGWDYDNVRAERDELRDFRAEAQDALDLVDTFARMSGKSRAEYIDWAHQQRYVQQGLDEANAQAMVERDKWQAQQEAQTRAAQQEQMWREAQQVQAQQQQAARRRDMEAFIKAFPGVKGSDIPAEVWADANQCGSLTAAYTRAENRRLTAEIAAMRQNETNRQKSTGGMGGRTQTDDTDALWGDDDPDEW